MEAGCEAARGFALRWEEQGGSDSPAAGLEAFRSHLSTCPDCRRDYGALLPLMERDLAPRPGPPPDEAFVRRVMDSLPTGATRGRARSRLAWVSGLAAAAALAIVLGGLSLLGKGLPVKEGDTVAIHFSVDAPDAASVVLVGSFSDWSKDKGYRLEKSRAGSWELSVRLRRNALYSYGFLIDGERWMADPRATEVVDDGFGGTNSLLRL